VYHLPWIPHETNSVQLPRSSPERRLGQQQQQGMQHPCRSPVVGGFHDSSNRPPLMHLANAVTQSRSWAFAKSLAMLLRKIAALCPTMDGADGMPVQTASTRSLCTLHCCALLSSQQGVRVTQRALRSGARSQASPKAGKGISYCNELQPTTTSHRSEQLKD
jgi:hypothetical protein